MSFVDVWVNSAAEKARPGRKSVILIFEKWLKSKGFPSLEDAVKFQEQAQGRDRYRIVDLAVEHVKEWGGTYKTMSQRYTTIRSFFMRSRAELPKVSINFVPTRDATVGALNLETFNIFLRDSDLRDQAIYLSLFQGLMDQHRFFLYFNPKGQDLGEHIKKNGIDKSYRVNVLRGRKGNPKPYNTWIGRDALEAWKIYFDKERGWPKEGEGAALDRDGKPLSQNAFFLVHIRRLHRLGFLKENGNKATRSGVGLHEIRDLARSTLEKAKKDDFNTTSAEFWMGHTIDPLGYNKLWQVEPEYNLAQYNIAVRYLNILSGPVTTIAEDPEQLLERLKTSPAFHKYVESMMADNPVLASTIARAAFKDSETVREIFSRFVEEGLTITAEGLTIRAKQPKRTRSNA
jgi:hypothetical protein